MAINPPSDIVLGSVLAAEPSRYRAAADRLGRAAWDAVTVAAAPGTARSPSASQPSETASARPQTPPATSSGAAAKGRGGKPPDAFAQLEAFVLQTFVQTMLPKDSKTFFGKGTAGEVWKSMLAEKLGAQMASSNQLGLAKRLAAGRTGTVLPSLSAPALGGLAPPSSLTSILPYIQSAAPADDILPGDSAIAPERS